MNIRELVSMLDTNKIPKIFYDVQPLEMQIDFYQSVRFRMIQGCYMPTNNFIYINEADSFNQDEYIYSVLFHELTHFTGLFFRTEIILGHAKITVPVRVKEEYLAELTATKLMKYFNFETPSTIERSKTYFRQLYNDLYFCNGTILNDLELKQIDAESDQCMAYILNELFIPEKIKNIA